MFPDRACVTFKVWVVYNKVSLNPEHGLSSSHFESGVLAGFANMDAKHMFCIFMFS